MTARPSEAARQTGIAARPRLFGVAYSQFRLSGQYLILLRGICRPELAATGFDDGGEIWFVACRTARKPTGQHASDREASGDEGIGEVPFRPRTRPFRFESTASSRGGNAARVR